MREVLKGRKDGGVSPCVVWLQKQQLKTGLEKRFAVDMALFSISSDTRQSENSGASSRCSDVLTLLKAPLWPPTMLDEPMEFSRTGGHLRGHLQRLQVSRKANVLHKVVFTDSRLARDPVPHQ